MISGREYLKGRGSQIKTANPFLKQEYVQDHVEGLDEAWLDEVKTQVILTHPKTILNRVDSPDVGMAWSLNPYQGCEHGCIYCYARNTHHYWGYDAGLDFESKIIVKKNAAELLRKALDQKNWQPEVISISGNTDCYQPLERKFGITRQLLEVCLEYKNPMGILTKNALVLRDSDLLQELAKNKLARVAFTITALSEDIRMKLEPRTASYKKRLQAMETLTKLGVPCGIMAGPIIPGINQYETPEVIKAAADHGARFVGYTIVRLNGAIKDLFHDWLQKNYPERYHKVWSQIESMHGGKVNDSDWVRRMKGEGNIAESIHQLVAQAIRKYMGEKEIPPYNFNLFKRPDRGQLSLL